MAKYIAIADSTVKAIKESDYKNLLKQFGNLISEGNKIAILNGEKSEYEEKYSDSFEFPSEKEFLDNIDGIEEPIVFISGRDDIFELSRHRKALFVCPMWLENIGENAEKYGVKVSTPKQAYQIIKHSNNNNFWHTRKELNDGTMVFTLLDAKFRYFSTSANEGKMIDNFKKTIYGDEKTTFFDVLKYAMISALSNNHEYFDDVDIWTVFPSSSLELDENLMEFKKAIEVITETEAESYIEKEDFKDNLILRHTEKEKAHEVPLSVRTSNGSLVNLQTICLNPDFKGKVEGKTVCVIDDFLNHGYSFEAARNILKAAGAKQIILLALGFYQNDYAYQEFEIKGDPFIPEFEIGEVKNTETILNPMFKINPQAKVEIETLFSVFNSSW